MKSELKLSRKHFLKKSGILGTLVILARPFHALSKILLKPTGQEFKIIDFAQVSDVHITDGTNPLRAELLDNIPMLGDAWRPQQHMSVTAWDAVIHAINQQNAITPFDFAISTGDQVDNAMENEFQWLTDVANGNAMSDAYNKLVAEGKMTPVDPTGLDVPWYAAIGNHDTMIVGNFPARLMEAIHHRMEKYYGFEITTQDEVLEILSSHGFDKMPDQKDGYYSFDPNEYVHCIVLNTNNDNWIEGIIDDFLNNEGNLIQNIIDIGKALGKETIINDIFTAFLNWIEIQANEVIGGLADGTLDRDQFAWMKEEIEENSDKLCLVFSHHGPDSFMSPPGNITSDELKSLLCSYENVIAHIYGHIHHNLIVNEKNTDGSYWSISTCSIIEYPQEWRRISAWDNGDGTGVLSCRMLQHEYDDSITEAENDPQSDIEKHYGKSEDRDVDLEFIIPASVANFIINNPPSSDDISDPAVTLKNSINTNERLYYSHNKTNADSNLQCFIATAAFGSPMKSEVVILRKFRDLALKPTSFGRLFIRAYYRLSPSAAQLINKSPFLKVMFRGMLYPVIKIIKRFYDVER